MGLIGSGKSGNHSGALSNNYTTNYEMQAISIRDGGSRAVEIYIQIGVYISKYLWVERVAYQSSKRL